MALSLAPAPNTSVAGILFDRKRMHVINNINQPFQNDDSGDRTLLSRRWVGGALLLRAVLGTVVNSDQNPITVGIPAHGLAWPTKTHTTHG